MGERTTDQTAPRSSARKVQGQPATNEASRAMEVTLRDLLLDLDDRIFAGSLGALKVLYVCVSEGSFMWLFSD